MLDPARFAFAAKDGDPVRWPVTRDLPRFNATPLLAELSNFAAKLSKAVHGNLEPAALPAQQLGSTADALARVDGSGKTVPIAAQSLARLRYALHPTIIHLIATGFEPPQHRDYIIARARELRTHLQTMGHSVRLSYALPDISAILSKVSAASAPLLLYCSPGTHGDLPHPETIRLLSDLENAGIPFQLLSYTSVNPFAVRSMAVAASHKAGFAPFKLSGSSILDSDQPILLGVDQGHPRDQNESVLSLVAIDHEGSLLARYHARKERDETLNNRSLAKGVAYMKTALRQAGQDPPRPMFVLRDGRSFENEKLETWKGLCPPADLTVLEVIKQPTPRLFQANITPPTVGTVAKLEGGDDLLLYPVRGRATEVGHCIRCRVRRNPRDYTDFQLGELLTATCHMAGLGLHPSTRPAPIYWADGFAGVSATQLKFTGFTRLRCNARPPLA